MLLNALAAPPATSHEMADTLAVMLHIDEVRWSMAEERAVMDRLCAEDEEIGCHVDRWIQYGRANIDGLMEIAQPLCERGDPAACLAVGWWLTRLPDGTRSWRAENPSKGSWLIHKACLDGLHRACSEQAELRWDGFEIARDRIAAVDQATASCAAGDGHGCHLVADWTSDPVAAARAVELGDWSVAHSLLGLFPEGERPELQQEACSRGVPSACVAVRDAVSLSPEVRMAAGDRACHMLPPKVAMMPLRGDMGLVKSDLTSRACDELVSLRDEFGSFGDWERLAEEPAERWWPESRGVALLWRDEAWSELAVLPAGTIERATYRTDTNRAAEAWVELELNDGTQVQIGTPGCSMLRSLAKHTNKLPEVPWILRADGAPTVLDCLESDEDVVTHGARIVMRPKNTLVEDPSFQAIQSGLRSSAVELKTCREELGITLVEPAEFLVKVGKYGRVRKAKMLQDTTEPQLDACLTAWLDGMQLPNTELNTRLLLSVHLW